MYGTNSTKYAGSLLENEIISYNNEIVIIFMSLPSYLATYIQNEAPIT